MTEAQNRDVYHAEYRVLLKSVLAETLSENDSHVRSIFKEAIKEWLTEQLQDGGAWTVRILAAAFFVLVLVIIFFPMKR